MISPVGAEVNIPAHWHPSMTFTPNVESNMLIPEQIETSEYFRVFTGLIEVTLDGKKHTVTPESGEFHIPNGVVHSIYICKDIHAEFAERVPRDGLKKMRWLKRMLSRDGQEAEVS